MISRAEIRTLVSNGLWKQNASLVQLLGLCPLLAVTTNAGIRISTSTTVGRFGPNEASTGEVPTKPAPVATMSASPFRQGRW